MIPLLAPWFETTISPPCTTIVCQKSERISIAFEHAVKKTKGPENEVKRHGGLMQRGDDRTGEQKSGEVTKGESEAAIKRVKKKKKNV